MVSRTFLVCTFVGLYILAAAVTMASMYFTGRSAPLITLNATTAFPNAAPQVAPPTTPPVVTSTATATSTQPSACFELCTAEETGDLVPCATKRLTPCSTDRDCATRCGSDEVKFQGLQCLAPGASWPSVHDNQIALNNGADKFCLPARIECLDHADDVTGEKQLVQCRQDTDCTRCEDELPNGESMVCQPLAGMQHVTFCDTEDKCHEVQVDTAGQYCVPRQTGCDPQYGEAQWTANLGWTCTCKYSSLFGGEHCTDLIACQARDVAPWAAKQQQLLLNMPFVNADGVTSKVGDPWSPATGVDPTKCVSGTGEQVECGGEEWVPTVACQCDGMQNGSQATYTYVKGDPLACTIDPCFQNALGGRTMATVLSPDTDAVVARGVGDAPNEFPSGPGLATTCACSGFGSSVWSYSTSAGKFVFTGHCEDTRIPGTSITLKKADPAPQLCATQINTAAHSSVLVPGKNDEGGDKCTPDPCAGRYSDPGYATEQSLGYYNQSSGKCECAVTATVNSRSVQLPVCTNKPGEAADPPGCCDHVVNPVCSFCADACILGLDASCPLAQGSTCANRRCTTAADGSRKCECGVDCFFYAGKCHQKIPNACNCAIFNGVEGACENPDDTCHTVESIAFPMTVKRQAIVCFASDRQKCGERTDLHKPCGGNSDMAFKNADVCGSPPAL